MNLPDAVLPSAPRSRPAPARRLARASGVTLIELLVTVAVAALIITLGVPSFVSAITRHAIQSQAEELQDAVRIGRNEAMKRSGPVILCRTEPDAPRRCAGTGGNWQTWLMFADIGRRGTYAADDPLVRERTDVSKRTTVTSDTPSIRFDATGIAVAESGTSAFVFAPAGQASGNGGLGKRLCVNQRAEVAVVQGDAACP